MPAPATRRERQRKPVFTGKEPGADSAEPSTTEKEPRAKEKEPGEARSSVAFRWKRVVLR